MPDAPEVAGTWERLPAAPLLPRGGTRAVWTGSEVVFWGGQAIDPNTEPCPPAASCAGPPPGPEAKEAAAYDPATRTWRRLVGTPPTYGHPLWSHGRLLDQSGAYDPTTGTTTYWPRNDLLVYASAQVVGDDLVTVGWDYRPDAPGGTGQVSAAALDLTDPGARWRLAPWPFPPPGTESLRTAVDGADVVVVSSVADPDVCGGEDGGYCSRVLRFTPATGMWTDEGTPPQQGREVIAADGHVAWSPTPPGEDDPPGDLLASPAGQVASTGWGDVRVRGDDGRWRRLPPAPGDPVLPAVVWAGEDLVVWGGAATEGEPESRNSADGWVFRPGT